MFDVWPVEHDHVLILAPMGLVHSHWLHLFGRHRRGNQRKGAKAQGRKGKRNWIGKQANTQALPSLRLCVFAFLSRFSATAPAGRPGTAGSLGRSPAGH